MLKLIAVDIDGTIVDDDKRVSPDFFDLLEAINELGVLFVVASGRNWNSIRQMFPKSDNTVFIAENGAFIHYQGEDLYTMPLDKAEADVILKEAEKIPGAAILYSVRNIQYIKNSNELVMREILPYVPVYKIVDSFEGIDEPPLEITLFDGNDEQKCYEFLSSLNLPNSKTAISGFSWLDVMHRSVDKGRALRMIMGRFGVSFHEAAAFGDNYNDIEMLESVYYSYAMKNSPEDVKKRARFVTEMDNNGFGAELQIRRLLGLTKQV